MKTSMEVATMQKWPMIYFTKEKGESERDGEIEGGRKGGRGGGREKE